MSGKMICLVSGILLLAFSGTASTQAEVWDNESGDGLWGNSTNWDPNGIPGQPKAGSEWAIISIPGTVATVDYNAKNCYGIIVENGTLVIADTADPECPSGETCATYNYVGSKAMAVIGRYAGDVGALVIGQNSAYTVNYNRWVGLKHFHIGGWGDGGEGAAADGTVDCHGTVWMGTTISTYIGKGNLEVGQGTGVLNIHDGAEFNTDFVGIGYGGFGTVNVSGGLLNSKRPGNLAFDVGAGDDGVGALNVSGGAVYLNGRLNLTGNNPTATGHCQLDGGLLHINDIYMGWGNGSMDVTGGEMINRWNNAENTATRKGRVHQYIDQGKITSYGGTGIFHSQNKWHDRYDEEGNYVDSDIDHHLTAIPPLEADLDILPSDDPNYLTQHTGTKARLPIALLGSADLDVTQINTDTIAIDGTLVPVKAPKVSDENGDGIDDLKLHFARRDVIMDLGLDTMDPGTVVTITVTANLVPVQFEYPQTGRPVIATDTVILQARQD